MRSARIKKTDVNVNCLNGQGQAQPNVLAVILNHHTLRGTCKKTFNNLEKSIAFIKIIEYAAYLTEANEVSFEAWLSERPKIDGVTLYRGYRLEKSFFEDGDYSWGQSYLLFLLQKAFIPPLKIVSSVL